MWTMNFQRPFLVGVTFLIPIQKQTLVKFTRQSYPFRRSVAAGLSLGTVLSVSITGLTAGVYGWELVFYTQGGAAVIFCVLWAVLVYDSPAFHPWISSRERKLIMDSTGADHHHKDVSRAAMVACDAARQAPVAHWRRLWWYFSFTHTMLFLKIKKNGEVRRLC